MKIYNKVNIISTNLSKFIFDEEQYKLKVQLSQLIFFNLRLKLNENKIGHSTFLARDFALNS